MCEHRGVVQGTRIAQHGGDAEYESEIADTVDQKGLQIREDCGRTRVPEADQQVGHRAHRFPAEEQLHEVVGHHQHQHGEGEQGDIAEEALIAVVVMHVADGVDVNHQGDEGHHRHHHRRQTVDEEPDLHVHTVGDHPGIDGGVEGLHAAGRELVEHIQRQGAGNGHAQDGDAVCSGPADGASEQARDHGRQQRRQHNGEINPLHRSLSFSPGANPDLPHRCCCARGTTPPKSPGRWPPRQQPRSR